jgi:hypothetical protein
MGSGGRGEALAGASTGADAVNAGKGSTIPKAENGHGEGVKQPADGGNVSEMLAVFVVSSLRDCTVRSVAAQWVFTGHKEGGVSQGVADSDVVEGEGLARATKAEGEVAGARGTGGAGLARDGLGDAGS